MANALKIEDFAPEPRSAPATGPVLRVIEHARPDLNDLPYVDTDLHRSRPSTEDTFREAGLESEVQAVLRRPDASFFDSVSQTVYMRRSTFEMTLLSGARRGDTLTLLIQHVGPYGYLAIIKAVETGEPVTMKIKIARCRNSAMIFAMDAE